MAARYATRIASDVGAPADHSTHLLATSTTVHHDDRSARVVLDGDLCAASATTVADLLDGLVAAGVVTVVIDLTMVRLCTSHGADVLETRRSELTSRGGTLTLEHPQRLVQKVLDILGIPLHVTA